MNNTDMPLQKKIRITLQLLSSEGCHMYYFCSCNLSCTSVIKQNLCSKSTTGHNPMENLFYWDKVNLFNMLHPDMHMAKLLIVS